MEFLFEVVIDAPRDEVFSFHANPANLSVLYGDRSTVQLLRHDGDIRPGCTTWIEERVGFCIPVVMGFRHSIYEPPHRFGEELIHGPYRRFSHIHEFEELPDGTVVRDRLTICLSRMFGGEMGMRFVIAPLIRKRFWDRHRRLRALARSSAFARFATGRGD